MQRGDYPYKNIGQRLKQWRQELHESVAEVSGAVEIDSEQLQRFEKGTELPSEDILLLLISHLGVSDNEARVLMEQAGYLSGSSDTTPGMSHMDEQMIKQLLMIIPFDNRIMYSDAVNISATPKGVVFDFLQKAGNPQPATIGRIGMSMDHAKKLQKLLNEMIPQTRRPIRLLEQPKNKPSQTEKPNQN